MKLEECFTRRLLRKIPRDEEKVKKSLEIAEKFYKDATKLIEEGVKEFSIVAAYSSMFHAARALLYRDGVQEKSHYATSLYLKEKNQN